MALALALSASYFQHTSAAQSVTPAAINELSIDDGSAECILGIPTALKGKPGFGWVNRLTPASYPATLRSISIGFNRTGVPDRAVKPDSPYRIVVYVDPEKDGPGNNQQPDASFTGRVRGNFLSIMTFTLATPLTIQSGSFVVGAMDEFGIADFAALYDIPGKSTPAGSESFATFNNGVSWQKFSDLPFSGTSFCEQAGSFIIRATIETGAVDALTVTKIQDPLAVEPWGVSVGPGSPGLTVVTNYVSDNLTVIKAPENTFQNVPVGDGPGGTPDGPFGVIVSSVANGNGFVFRTYVTLFGSNTIPTKEFPTDYSTVGEGRVVVLTQGTGAMLTPLVTINVGKGPRFPALATASGKTKLYVPCGGANRVDVIDTARNEKIAEIPVGLDPSSCVTSINNAKVYVTNFGDGSISVIDTKTDQKIKDIPAPHVTIPTPVGATDPPAAPLLKNPWNAAVSLVNGNLYVTYWGTVGDVFPNGAIAQFDTCRDEFVRATLDPATRGSAPGSAGASGIPAPTAPLVFDSETGATPGAGGGGGGPFAIASTEDERMPLLFTNDATGITGLLDTLIDQVVSAPPIALASCPKPRGVDGGIDPTPIPPVLGSRSGRIAYVACGQPDNAVLFFKVPALTQSIQDLPVVESIKVGNKISIRGQGFVEGMRLEVIAPDSLACLAFDKDPKIKKKGKLLEQKGNLSDGRKPGNVAGALIRLINPDGTVLILRASS
jgi:YVTN family beta-propeller protein